jgi:pyridinium-3,5-biscarboxylic acid mononucleotide sulfurtransferase
MQMDKNPMALAENYDIERLSRQLVESIQQFESCAVAFSGGVDSAVVAKAAFLALGDRSVAVTGLGAAVSQSDCEDAIAVALQIGVRHVRLTTNEVENPNYQANDARRCFYCKSELYQQVRRWCDSHGIQTILSGTNADDLNDYRPGLQAASDYQVRSPLASLGITKVLVRRLAEYWHLPIASKPASPCLASRIAYGQLVTIERLGKIERAERWLGAQGFVDVRVRLHADNLARIELHLEDFERATSLDCRAAIVQSLRDFGFDFVTIDLAGRESGSLNRAIRKKDAAQP